MMMTLSYEQKYIKIIKVKILVGIGGQQKSQNWW